MYLLVCAIEPELINTIIAIHLCFVDGNKKPVAVVQNEYGDYNGRDPKMNQAAIYF